MLSSQYFSPYYEIDEIYSLASSPESFEQFTESFIPHNHLLPFTHLNMNENSNQSSNLLYPTFDWSMCNKSQIYTRDELSSFPDLQQQSPQAMSWKRPEDHNPEYLRTKSYSPPSYISPSITHRHHPRVKSAAACLVSDHQFISPISVPSALVPTNDKAVLESTRESTSSETNFLFNIVLNAPTAVSKKSDEDPITYLNRGQSYLFNFEPTAMSNTVTSVISVAFHEPSHRAVAKDYWKSWITQQKNPAEAKVLDLDINQTTGIFNIRMISFDRISFDWHSRFGAKLCVRFNCLSTDFSRIKGVKGIPMRVAVETTQRSMELLPISLKGTCQKSMNDEYEYKEVCFCKIKLFRDKGAERKNKDDKRQIQKQIEKLVAVTNGNPEDHPLWPTMKFDHNMTSPLNLAPTSPDMIIEEIDDFDDILLDHTLPPISTKRKHPFSESTSIKRKRISELTFYVWSRHFSANPTEMLLDKFTLYDFKSKLAEFLSIHPTRISEVVWRRKKSEDDILVLVEDTFISEHIIDGEVMELDWVLQADGSLRIILEF